MKTIDGKEGFLSFVRFLAEDYRVNGENWENSTLDSFLEGIEGWVEDMDGYYENIGLEKPENINWKTFADILSAARVYE